MSVDRRECVSQLARRRKKLINIQNVFQLSKQKEIEWIRIFARQPVNISW